MPVVLECIEQSIEEYREATKSAYKVISTDPGV